MNPQLCAGRAYQTVQITTASAPHVVLMLYEGGLKFAGLAKRYIEEGNRRKAYKFRGKLLSVLSELTRSLALDSGYEAANSFFFLYDHMSKLARDAGIDERGTCGFDEVIYIMGELRNAWKSMLAQKGMA